MPALNLTGMLAQATATIPFDSTAVSAALIDPRRPWSLEADGDGRALLERAGFKVGPVPVYKRVTLRVGRLPGVAPAARLMVPVTWEAVGGPPIFPAMQGSLHVEPDGQSATRLTLNASYDPPMGKLGEGMDRIVMHRLAQITMSDFIARLAAALQAAVGAVAAS
jgi:hypothetical protein